MFAGFLLGIDSGVPLRAFFCQFSQNFSNISSTDVLPEFLPEFLSGFLQQFYRCIKIHSEIPGTRTIPLFPKLFLKFLPESPPKFLPKFLNKLRTVYFARILAGCLSMFLLGILLGFLSVFLPEWIFQCFSSVPPEIIQRVAPKIFTRFLSKFCRSSSRYIYAGVSRSLYSRDCLGVPFSQSFYGCPISFPEISSVCFTRTSIKVLFEIFCRDTPECSFLWVFS